MTKEQFRAQFNREIQFSDEVGYKPEFIRFDREYQGYNIYRALDKLILEDADGRLFIKA